MMIQRYPRLLKFEIWDILRLIWYTTTLIDTFIYAWKVPEFQKGYRKILCCLRRVSTIQVAPRSNVQSRGIDLPLEPRREVEYSGVVKGCEAATVTQVL